MRNPQSSILNSRSGFTLIELLVVVAITAMISTFAITYSKIGQRQVTLYVEEQKIASLIQKARSLAVTIYSQGVPGSQLFCGYGLEIDYGKNTYSIFAYKRAPGPPSPTACETIADIIPGFIDSNSGNVPSSFTDVSLDANVKFNSAPADALRYVLFVAPNPKTIVSSDPGGGHSTSPATIYLETVDGRGSVAITVNASGQVDF